MNKTERKAARAKRLREDEVFQEAMQEIRDAQIRVFLNVSAPQEDREEAHQVIRALSKIEGWITGAISTHEFEQKKGQHRGSD